MTKQIPMIQLWISVVADYTDQVYEACVGLCGPSHPIQLNFIDHIELSDYLLTYGRHEVDCIPESFLLKDAPALGAKFNVMLLEDDKSANQLCKVYTEWDSELFSLLRQVQPPQWGLGIYEFVTKCAALAYALSQYGRCLWRKGRAPRQIASPQFGWEGLFEISSTLSDNELLVRSRRLGAACARLVRATLNTYARLTVATCYSRDERDAMFRDFRTRLTDDSPLEFPERYSSIGSHCFRDWSLTWLQTGDLPEDAYPHHGPGQVAEGLAPFAKGACRYWVDPRLWWVNEQLLREPMASLNEGFAPPDDKYGWGVPPSYCAVVTAVPKDYRGPRLIAKEPALRQYLQEGVLKYFVHRIRRTPLSAAIDLARQDKNAQDALQGSLDRKVATLDLKDASDRVRTKAVMELFKFLPCVSQYLLALRTGRVKDRSGAEYDITAYATMGSSLTFPLETMVITCLLVSGLWDRVMTEREYVSCRNVRKCIARARIRVYGDDVIVRSDLALQAMNVLERAGLMINRRKCCYRSFFRESCGTDALAGQVVTIPRPRGLPGAKECTWEGIIANANEYAQLRCYRTAVLLIAIAEKSWHKTVPILSESHQAVPGCICNDYLSSHCSGEYNYHHFDRNLQRPIYRTWRTCVSSTWSDPGFRRYWDNLAKTGDPMETTVSKLPDGKGRVRLKPLSFDSRQPVGCLTAEDIAMYTRMDWSSIPKISVPDILIGYHAEVMV